MFRSQCWKFDLAKDTQAGAKFFCHSEQSQRFAKESGLGSQEAKERQYPWPTTPSNKGQGVREASALKPHSEALTSSTLSMDEES